VVRVLVMCYLGMTLMVLVPEFDVLEDDESTQGPTRKRKTEESKSTRQPSPVKRGRHEG